MERATRSKRNTNVTIWRWTCWGWCPKTRRITVGFRCGFDDCTRTQRSQRESLTRESLPGDNMWPSVWAQKRPNGTFSPLPSVKENYGSPNPFKSRNPRFFVICCFSLLSRFPPTKCPFRWFLWRMRVQGFEISQGPRLNHSNAEMKK